MHSKVLIAFSEELKKALLALALERLTHKQKLILHSIEQAWEPVHATHLAKTLSRTLICSESAIWNNLNGLKRANLVSCGDIRNKGVEVTLTPAGKLILDGGKEKW